MRVFLVPLAGACVALGLCGAAERPAAKVTAADAGRTIDLKPGQALQVVLEANHTTGYSWAIDKTDPAIIKVAGAPEYVTSNARPGMTGAGGTEIWQLAAVAPGEQAIRFTYRRPFEPTAPPARTFAFRVKIQP